MSLKKYKSNDWYFNSVVLQEAYDFYREKDPQGWAARWLIYAVPWGDDNSVSTALRFLHDGIISNGVVRLNNTKLDTTQADVNVLKEIYNEIVERADGYLARKVKL